MFHCFIAYVIFIFYFIIIILFFLHCPLSEPVPTYISLLIIPCMIVYVTNNKEPWTLNLEKNLNIEKIAFKVDQMKSLTMHITNQ